MDRSNLVKRFLRLRKLKYNNKTYALDQDTNELYDYNLLMKGTLKNVGKLNLETNKKSIDFYNKDSIDSIKQSVRRNLDAINTAKIKRFNEKAIALGDDIMIASKEMRLKDWTFHLKAFLSTFCAWTFRFTILSSLIIAFTPISIDFQTQFALFARLETMFVIIAFSPTPGGAGVIEALFSSFFTDYLEQGTQTLVISFIWRIITYYSYLIIGAFIIPNWIRKVINTRKQKRIQQRKSM